MAGGVPAGRLSIEIVAEIARLQQDLDKAKRAVNAASNDIARSAKAANDNLAGLGSGLNRAGATGKLAGHHMQNLAFQFQDLGVQMTMAAQSSEPLKMALMALMQQGAQIQGIMSQANVGVGGLTKELVGRFGPALGVATVALGAIAGALKVFTDDINENSKVTVTWGDFLLGTFDAVRSYLTAEFGPTFEWIAEVAGTAWEWIAEASKRSSNFMISAMVAVPKLIVAAWDTFPAAIAEIVVDAANGGIKAIERLINGAIAGLNQFISLVNSIVGTSFKTIGTVDLPEIEQRYAGAGKRAGAAMAGALTSSYKDYIGDFVDFVSPFAQARARKRLGDDAEKAGKSAGKKAGKSAADEFAKELARALGQLADDVDDAFLKIIMQGREAAAKRLEANLKAVMDEIAKNVDERQKPMRENAAATAEWNEKLRETIDLLDQIGASGQALGDIGAIIRGLTSGDFSGARGPAGFLLANLFTTTDMEGKRVLNQLGQDFRGVLDKVFGGDGTFAKTMNNLLQGAGTGSAVGAILGGGKAGQIGAQIGGAIGSAVAGPIGSVVGSVLGNLAGGVLSSTKRGGATFGGYGSSLGAAGTWGNSGQRIGAATGLAGNVVDALNQIAGAFGAELGTFTGSISMRKNSLRYDPTGRGISKTSKGAIDFGQDQEALLQAAIADAISDGVFKGLSAGVERLLRGEGDIEAKLQKALSFQGVFDELAQRTNPQQFELDQLAKWRSGMDAIFAEAGATAEELAKLEELTGLKRAEIVKKYADTMTEAEEAARQKATEAARIHIEMLTAVGLTEKATAIARAQAIQEVEESLRPLQQFAWAIQDATAELPDTIRKFQDLRDSLRDFRSDLIASNAPTGDAYRTAQVKWLTTSALAAAGDERGLADLQKVSTAFLDASKAQSSTAEQYQRDYAAVLRALDSGISAADNQVSEAQRQLQAAQDAVSQLVDLNGTAANIEATLAAMTAAINDFRKMTKDAQASDRSTRVTIVADETV